MRISMLVFLVISLTTRSVFYGQEVDTDLADSDKTVLLPNDPASRYVNGTPIDWLKTDEAVHAHITSGKPLKKLFVPFQELNDSAFSALAEQDTLEALGLQRTQVTYNTFAQLPKLTKLLCLNVEITGFDNRSLKAVSSLPELRALYLYGTKVTENGLTSLRKLKKLKILTLPDTPIKMSRLTVLPASLISVGLGNRLSGEALHLNHLKHCKYLTLGAKANKDLVLDGLKLTNLESLNLMPYGKIDLALISKILRNNQNITVLEFRPDEPGLVERLKKDFRKLKRINGFNVTVETPTPDNTKTKEGAMKDSMK